MMQEAFTCKRCGLCCLYASFSEVGEEDIRLWEEGNRTDILEWVRLRPIGGGDYAYEVWFDPRTKQEVDECPWLGQLPDTDEYMCHIYDVRPGICRYFPASRKHAEEIGCKGLEEIVAEKDG
jgi:Fe-S-cluster containining protein